MKAKTCASFAGVAAFALVAAAGPCWSQSGPRSATVVVQGVTVTGVPRQKPTDGPPPLEAYATPAPVEHVALSPDGTRAAYVLSISGTRALVVYQIADHSTQLVRIRGNDVTSIAWANDGRLLATSSKSSLRGTCDVGDQRIIQSNLVDEKLAVEFFSENYSGSHGVRDHSSNSEEDYLYGVGARSCVYYGTREHSFVVLIDLEKKVGRAVGLRFGEYIHRPLGTPDRTLINGELRLVGPFLEIRDQGPLSTVDPQPVERVFLWSLDPKTAKGRRIDDGGGDVMRAAAYVDDWLLDPKGQIVARSLYDFHKKLFAIEMRREGVWKPVLTRPIVAKDHTFAPFLIGLGPETRSVVILDDAASAGHADGRAAHYLEIAEDGTLKGPLEPDDAALDTPIFSPETRQLAGFARSGLEETYALTDPELKSIYQAAQNAVPGEIVKVVATADDPRRMIIHSVGRENPGGYYFVDLASGSSAVIGLDHPQIHGSWFAAQTQITYSASDGLQIEAILTLPPTASKLQNLPLVILPHDGPQGHDELGFDWLAQALASRGYLVLQPQYRGSDGMGPAFRAAGFGQLGRKMQSDLADGVRHLVSQGLADPRRVCIVGVGVGGYAAMIGAMDAATYRCAASINGVSDLKAQAAALRSRLAVPEQDQITNLVADLNRSRAFKLNPESPGILERYMGTEPPLPLKSAPLVSVPVLLVHETNDKVVSVQQSRTLRDALHAAGKTVDLVEVKGPSDHALATPDARLSVLQAILGFVEKHAPPA